MWAEANGGTWHQIACCQSPWWQRFLLLLHSSSAMEQLNYLILIGEIALETRVVVEASSIAFKQVFQQINIFLASEVSNPYFVFSRWKSWPHFQKGVSSTFKKRYTFQQILIRLTWFWSEVCWGSFFFQCKSLNFSRFIFDTKIRLSSRAVLTFASSSKNRTNNSFLLYAQGVFFLCDVITTSFVLVLIRASPTQ